jgi:protein SCO1/2
MMDHATCESEVAALVEDVKRHPHRRDRLADLLPERHPLYAGRSSNAVVRLCGYVLAAFEQVGLPERAVPFVLDELQNGRDAYLVAAAAMAIRGLEQPTDDVVPFLLSAIRNIKYCDDKVTFATFAPRWPAPAPTTAMTEIVKSIAWLGDWTRSARAAMEELATDGYAVGADVRSMLQSVLADLGGAHSCCHHAEQVIAPRTEPAVHNAGMSVPAGIEMQDQDGQSVLSQDFFYPVPSVVAFFYTRCDNPNKCSLTVTKLAQLQRLLRQDGLSGQVRTAGISYDPGYDLPSRLRAYGRNRGVEFSDDDRFLRIRVGFDALREFFELGVNYGPTLVNRHRIELFVLDRRGRIRASFTRLQWDTCDVLGSVQQLV